MRIWLKLARFALETSTHRNSIFLLKFLDNLPFSKTLAGITLFLLMFSKLSPNCWINQPASSYKFYGKPCRATLKTNFVSTSAVEEVELANSSITNLLRRQGNYAAKPNSQRTRIVYSPPRSRNSGKSCRDAESRIP